MLGLNFLVANQIDQAIDELTRAAESVGDPLEIRLILGNLYRAKGQVGRAIQEHQALLQRPHLRKLEHANVLLCLGLDYRRGGFIDRATEAFKEVLRLDPGNQYALANLEKLYEEQHQWTEAYTARQQLAAGDSGAAAAPPPRDPRVSRERDRPRRPEGRRSTAAATARFEAAIELDNANAPAHLNLGDARLARGDRAGACAGLGAARRPGAGEGLSGVPRLETAYEASSPDRFPALCRQLIASQPQDWRARVALSRHLRDRGAAREALRFAARGPGRQPARLPCTRSSGSRTPGRPRRTCYGGPAFYLDPLRQPLHGALWHAPRVEHFYVDPHICVRCRYRSTELLRGNACPTATNERTRSWRNE
jgi:lipopolysaccharide assembly protein B